MGLMLGTVLGQCPCRLALLVHSLYKKLYNSSLFYIIIIKKSRASRDSSIKEIVAMNIYLVLQIFRIIPLVYFCNTKSNKISSKICIHTYAHTMQSSGNHSHAHTPCSHQVIIITTYTHARTMQSVIR